MIILPWIMAFVQLFMLDFFWASYTKQVQLGRAVAAGVWAMGLYALGAFATMSWINDPWLLIPSCVGAFAGTWFGVWLDKRKALNEVNG